MMNLLDEIIEMQQPKYEQEKAGGEQVNEVFEYSYLDKPSLLKPCDWALYRLLLGLKPNGFTCISFADICYSLPKYFSYIYGTKCQSNHCPSIYQSVARINNSSQVDKWIVINEGMLRFATEQELKDTMEQIRKRAMTYLVRLSRAKRKMRNNGQGKIISNADKVIDENSKAKPFVETFEK